MKNITTILVHMNNIPFKEKPQQPITAALVKDFSKAFPIVQTTPKALAEATAAGHGFVPGIFPGLPKKNVNWRYQQVFALDFDDPAYSIDQHVTDFKAIGVYPAFIYTSFSHQLHGHDRFRSVFILDWIIGNRFLHQVVVETLREFFPRSDESCADPARLFFGGRGIVYENYDSRINPVELILLRLSQFRRDPAHFSQSVSRFAKQYEIGIRDNSLVIVPGNDSPSTPRFEGLPLFSFDPCVIRGKTIEINNDVAAFNTERIISSSPAMDIVPTPSFSCKALLRSQISEERPMPSPANSVQSI